MFQIPNLEIWLSNANRNQIWRCFFCKKPHASCSCSQIIACYNQSYRALFMWIGSLMIGSDPKQDYIVYQDPIIKLAAYPTAPGHWCSTWAPCQVKWEGLSWSSLLKVRSPPCLWVEYFLCFFQQKWQNSATSGWELSRDWCRTAATVNFIKNPEILQSDFKHCAGLSFDSFDTWYTIVFTQPRFVYSAAIGLVFGEFL